MKLCKELIEIHLARRSMTAKDLCRIGIASNTIVRAMRGENLTTKTAGRIARALGVDVTEILKQEGVPGGTPPPDKPARARFVPPDESEAIAYFRERGSNAQEAAAFLNYYTANGWMVGKNRMKDWRAAARGWMQRAGQYSGKAAAPQSSEEFTDQLTRVANQLASGNISILGGIYDNK